MSENNLEYLENKSLKNKIVLLTGATGGIGRAVCKKFMEIGAIVYICDIKDSDKLASEINNQFGQQRSIPIKCDIAKKEEVEKMYQKITNEHQGVDILINNAAIHGKGNFPQITFKEFLKTIKIDLSGALYCTLKAIPYMKKNKWGRIIFTGAPLSSSGIPCPYLAGKSGFIGLTKYISKKYSTYDIRTFCLVLRHCDTPMIRRVMKARGKDLNNGIKQLHNKSKTGRMITPEEVAEIYIYFCSAKSPNINGTTLLSDGGITYL